MDLDAGETQVFDTHETNYLLSKVEPEDLIQFGMIPEFVGRFNSIANCNELTIEDLVDILIKPKNAIVKQYQQLFAEEGIQLHFDPESLKYMAERAKSTGTGARALRMIVESMLLNLMFEAPSDPTIKEITINKECVLGNAPPLVKRSA